MNDDRCNAIIKLVEKYYSDNEFLQVEPVEVIINRALNLFKDTDFTIEEVDEKLAQEVKLKKEEIDEDNRELRNMVSSKNAKIEEIINPLISNNYNALNESGYALNYTLLFCILILITIVITCISFM